MKGTDKILIGGQALLELGSSRYTNDVDYLVNDLSNKNTFICSEEIDLINANGNAFFKEIYNLEKGNKIASPQSLLELKAYSFVQHCQNFNWNKVNDCEFDMKFLALNFNVSLKIVKKYISQGEFNECIKVINSAKK